MTLSVELKGTVILSKKLKHFSWSNNQPELMSFFSIIGGKGGLAKITAYCMLRKVDKNISSA